MNWNGQRVLITGASAGIGRATALELARRGAHVFAAARSLDKLEALAVEAAASQGQIVPLHLDVTDAASIGAAADTISAATRGYGLDVLINNAGYGLMGALEELELDAVRQQFETNVFGVIALIQQFLPAMRQRRAGWIVNVSSIGGRLALPFGGAYTASKFALEALSAALRVEVARWNIRVLVVEPGPTATDFPVAVRENYVAVPATAYPETEDFVRMFEGHNPDRQIGASPHTIATDMLGAIERRFPPLRIASPRFWGPLLWLAELLPQRLINLVFTASNRRRAAQRTADSADQAQGVHA